MRRALTIWAGIALAAAPAMAADPNHPAVVELYQSQGCSSCPPANAVLNQLADRPDVLALSFAVTYWDQLGWKDIFAKPAFTQRQWDYARSGGRPNVATPQMIINGRTAITGSRRLAVDAAIAAADRGASGPRIDVSGRRVTVAAGKPAADGATLWLVHYDPRTIQVPVRAGENGGRTLPHRNIVRGLIALGRWTGAASQFNLPAAPAGLRAALLLQAGRGGPILASRRI